MLTTISTLKSQIEFISADLDYTIKSKGDLKDLKNNIYHTKKDMDENIRKLFEISSHLQKKYKMY